MSLIKCHECGKKVSTEAGACPNCGAAPRIPVPISPEARIRNLKYMAAVGFAAFVFYAGYNAYSDWSEKRANKKAIVAEFMRRNSMTPQQRIAEDQLKAQQVAREAQIRKMEADRKALEDSKRGKLYACRQALISTLNDPGSFSYIESYGSQDDSGNGIFNAFVKGRARNGFGALITGTWMCEVTESGPNLVVNTVKQISPRIR